MVEEEENGVKGKNSGGWVAGEEGQKRRGGEGKGESTGKSGGERERRKGWVGMGKIWWQYGLWCGGVVRGKD